MKRITTKKKGFTIVELVIVIAVIGILAAILIPTFINLNNRAIEVKQKSFIADLNEQLAINDELVEGKVELNTYHDVKEFSAEVGYNVDKLTPVDGNTLVYDSVNNKFFLADDEGNPLFANFTPSAKNEDRWVIVKDASRELVSARRGLKTKDNVAGLIEAGYSVYLADNEYAGAINVKAGFDAGENKNITTVTYANSGAAKNVSIRTNGGSLKVNAPSDSLKHFGKADNVNIEKIASNSYREHGEVGYATIANGRLVIEESAEIEGIYLVANDAGEFDGIKLAVVGDAELPSLARADVELENGESKLVVEVQTLESSEAVDSNPEYVWITGTSTGTETAVSSSATSADQTVETPSTAASSASVAVEEAVEPIKDNTVARIGAIGYESFDEAVASAKKGEKIYILKDFTLNSDIGGWSDNKLYDGLFEGSVSNEVVLTKDITINFSSYNTIYLAKGGRFTLDGHKLTLKGAVEGCGIANCQKLFDNDTDHNIVGYTPSGDSAIVTQDLVYAIESEYAPLMFALAYRTENSKLKWQCSSVFYFGIPYDVASFKSEPINKGEYTLDVNETVNLEVPVSENATYSWNIEGAFQAENMMLGFTSTDGNTATLKAKQGGMFGDINLYAFCDVYEENGSLQRYYWSITIPGGLDFDF